MTRPPSLARAERQVMRVVRRDGLLLFTDSRHPSVVSLLVGAPVAGSWFAHPASHLIYNVGQRLEDAADVLSVPLLDRKVTLVHRRLWPELLAVATGQEPWQHRGLTGPQSELLRLTERRGRVNVQHETDGLRPAGTATAGDLARGLERRLLVYGHSVHSPSGRHEKVLETWKVLAADRAIRVSRMAPEIARSRLEAAVRDGAAPEVTRRRFPWGRTD
ncbi:MAG: hypothetical protein L3J73_03230 [Thermoplasmata archaeon]|nr:hypothetical protein [Thermoplasmata archaeon]